MTLRQRRIRVPIANYNPRPPTLALLNGVSAVLEESLGLLAPSVRAIYYRLLGTGRYAKSRGLAGRLSEQIGNARRAGWCVVSRARTSHPSRDAILDR